MSHRPKVLVTRRVFDETLDKLAQYCDVQSNQGDDMFSPSQLREHLRDKHGALTTLTDNIDREVLQAAPHLRALANIAVGYNNFSLEDLKQHKILATNTPDVLTETTADLAMALLLGAARHLPQAERWLRAGHWSCWRVEQFLGRDIHGSRIGIVGMGRIGEAVARRALGFGARVYYHNRRPREVDFPARHLPLAQLLGQVDHLILTLPYSPQVHHLIGAKELATMQPHATLVNVARGGIVDDRALAHALRTGVIFAAGLDVFENEPAVCPDLLECDNALLTPHIGSASDATRRRMCNLAADNLIAALGLGPDAGHPPNLIDQRA